MNSVWEKGMVWGCFRCVDKRVALLRLHWKSRIISISAFVLLAIVSASAFGAAAIPGQIEAEDYNTGGEGVGYHDTTAGNTGGAYRSDNVDMIYEPAEGGSPIVGWTATGEWLNYDVDVQTAGNYDLQLRVARGTTGNGALHLGIDGVNITGTVSIPDTGDWSSYTTLTVKGIPLSAGAHVLRLTFDSPGINVNWINFTLASSGGNLPPVADPGGPYTALLGNAITFDGSGSHDPDTSGPLTYDWNFGDGSVHGTGVAPSHTYAAVGPYTVTLIVNDSIDNSPPVSTTANIAGSAAAIPGQIEAEDYNTGGEGVDL